MEVLDKFKSEVITVEELKKGSKFQYMDISYVVMKVTQTDVQIKRADSKSNEPTATLKIGSDRFNKMFLGSLDGVYTQILNSETILDLDLTQKQLEDSLILDFTDLVDTLRVGSNHFSSKTEATVWCMDALNGDIIEPKYRNPLYTILSLYYKRTNLTEIDEKAIQKYIRVCGFRDKYTNFIKFTELALGGAKEVQELYTYIPDEYETIVSEFMLGRVKLNISLLDLQYILNVYIRRQQMKFKDLSDNTIIELATAANNEVEERGLEIDTGAGDEEGMDLAGILEGLEVKEVLDTVKDVCGVTIRGTAKTLGLDEDALAELLEAKLDEDQLEELMETLAEDDEDDEDDADEEDEEDEEDEDEEDDEVDSEELAEALEEALEESSILDILEEAEVEVKLTAKQKKMDAEELAEVLIDKLDEDDLETLMDYLLADEEDEEDDSDDSDDEDDADLEEMLEEAMEESSILDILEEAEVEVKLTAKQKKFDAGAMAELLEEKLDEDQLELLIDYLAEMEDDEDDEDDADEEDEEDEEDEDINIDDLDDEEIVELAEEEGLKVKKVKNKVSPATIKALRKELKELFED